MQSKEKEISMGDPGWVISEYKVNQNEDYEITRTCPHFCFARLLVIHLKFTKTVQVGNKLKTYSGCVSYSIPWICQTSMKHRVSSFSPLSNVVPAASTCISTGHKLCGLQPTQIDLVVISNSLRVDILSQQNVIIISQQTLYYPLRSFLFCT